MDAHNVRHVYIVDDDALVRAELAEALQLRGFMATAFDSGEGFLARQDALEPGCVVLDLNMPGMGGMEVQQAMVDRRSRHKIVMLTGAGSVSTAVRAMHAGAIDFLEKPFHVDDLVRAVGSAINSQFQEVAQSDRKRNAAEIVERLSERELDVLCGMVLGLANKVIAYRLSLSPRTVESYRAQLMQKLGVRSLAEAVHIAMEAELEPRGAILRSDPEI
ncbi:LuxR family two component transcriptional regulator [Blastomonas natatoria]|uniref:LuxR family two component transcriptional regulator n=1 Tax=Blastomonas natatoria TaxID=34015 RepID=A0A2V3V2T9_9SPHN|nr:response regulator [Blastomonas natatoria]PXW76106.1 LuxR family two component transcriptional regulator [Blastomonas natatoria]